MSSYPDKDLESEIISAFLRFRSPFKVANSVGIGIDVAYAVLEKHPHLTTIPSASVVPEVYGGLGLPHLQQFAVARKRVTAEWDNTLPMIAAAREDYDAGTHEMFTGRDGDWLILYSKRRVAPAVREPYFAV